MSVEMADGSLLADVKIPMDSDTLQTEVSVMTVTSERWMERFIMNPQVLCLDGLASDDDPEDACFRIRYLQWYPYDQKLQKSGWTGLS